MVARLLISMTIGVFVTTYVIRSLSIAEYGIYTVLYSLIGYVSALCSFGIPEVFRRFIPEALQKRDYALLKCLVFRGLILRIVLSILTVGIILLLHEHIGRILRLQNFLNYFLIFAFAIVFFLEASLLTSVLHSLFLHKYSVIASTIYSIFRGLCVFVLVRVGWGLHGVLIAEALSWGVWTILLWLFYYVKFTRNHPTEKNVHFPLIRYFRYGGLSSLNELGSSVQDTSTDFFIITAFLGPAAVAPYAFAERIVKMFLRCMPHVVLIDVIRPSFFTKYVESGNKQHLSIMFNLLLKLGAFCVFPLAAGILVLGDKMIMTVFKSEYLSAEPILWIWILYISINVIANPTTLVLQALELLQINLYSKIFGIYNLIVALLVIQKFGVMGVVIVTCSAGIMKNIFCYYYAKKYGNLSIDFQGLFKIICNATIMALPLILLRSIVNDIISLSLVTVLGIVLFLMASWSNKAFNSEERNLINRVAPKPIFVF